jgi:heme-degrading monooxygenase HmoA
MVFATVADGAQGDFERAYAEVSARVAGTPGHIRDELLRDSAGSASYILLSEWESEEQFRAWEDAPIHRELTTPMRPYWAGRIERRIYDVAARPGNGG